MRNHGWTFLGVLLVCTAPCLEADILYTVTDLADLGGGGTGVSGINDQGQVTGSSHLLLPMSLMTTGTSGDPPTGQHAFLYSDGRMNDLGTLGGSYSVGLGINNAGQVVGETQLTSGDVHAFLYTNGRMADLGTLGGPFSIATGINNTGQVVGQSEVSTGEPHALLYSNGQMTDLTALIGSFIYTANDINNAGQILLIGSVPGGSHAFLYSNGQIIDLGAVGASAINDA